MLWPKSGGFRGDGEESGVEGWDVYCGVWKEKGLVTFNLYSGVYGYVSELLALIPNAKLHKLSSRWLPLKSMQAPTFEGLSNRSLTLFLEDDSILFLISPVSSNGIVAVPMLWSLILSCNCCGILTCRNLVYQINFNLHMISLANFDLARIFGP